MFMSTGEKAINIGELQIGLFSGRSYLDIVAGVVITQLPFMGLEIKDKHIIIPRLSMAHVRQMFLKEKLLDSAVSDYDIHSFPQFPLESKEMGSDLERDYVNRTHWFCEDNDLEAAFWEYFYEYTLPIAINWCEQNWVMYKLES